MTDEYLIESSQKLEEQQLQYRIQQIQQKAGTHAVLANGACYDCGTEFDEHDPKRDVKKFCDSDCEVSWRQWYQAQVRKYGPGYKPRPAY